jgi:antitoxin ParD1/3/4
MAIAKRTFSIPAEHAKFIDKKVASGSYASGSEVVRAGLRALQERDAAVERWLLEEVAPTFDAIKADPSSAIPAKQVFAAIKARHAAQANSPAKSPRRVKS